MYTNEYRNFKGFIWLCFVSCGSRLSSTCDERVTSTVSIKYTNHLPQDSEVRKDGNSSIMAQYFFEFERCARDQVYVPPLPSSLSEMRQELLQR